MQVSAVLTTRASDQTTIRNSPAVWDVDAGLTRETRGVLPDPRAQCGSTLYRPKAAAVCCAKRQPGRSQVPFATSGGPAWKNALLFHRANTRPTRLRQPLDSSRTRGGR